MDVERFVELMAAQDFIEYTIGSDNMSDHNYIHVVYATVKDDTVIIAGTDESYLEIAVDKIKDITYDREDGIARVVQDNNEEVSIVCFFSPGDNFFG